MLLKDYLRMNRLDRKTFAQLCGISYVNICKYINGITKPREKNAYKIEEVTNGKVKLEDWREE